MECDNGYRAHLGQPIVSPACYRGKATTLVTITYDKYRIEKDELSLCDDCARLIKNHARRYGYWVQTKPLKETANGIL